MSGPQRIWSVNFSERFEAPSVTGADELADQGCDQPGYANPAESGLQDFECAGHRLHSGRLVHARSPAELGRRDRMSLPGTEGCIELCQCVDIGGVTGGDHLILMFAKDAIKGCARPRSAIARMFRR